MRQPDSLWRFAMGMLLEDGLVTPPLRQRRAAYNAEEARIRQRESEPVELKSAGKARRNPLEQSA